MKWNGEWVDGFEQNKVGNCLGVCHKMQHAEWWGTWPSPLVRKQGGRGAEVKMPLLTPTTKPTPGDVKEAGGEPQNQCPTPSPTPEKESEITRCLWPFNSWVFGLHSTKGGKVDVDERQKLSKAKK